MNSFIDLDSSKKDPCHSDATQLLGLKVLVADDAPDNLALIVRMLEIAGAFVDVAENGQSAVHMARHKDYDIILMDLQMPVMDGYKAVEHIRAQGFSRPIVAITAHARHEEKVRCLASGFDEHLAKPLDRHALIRLLAKLRASR